MSNQTRQARRNGNASRARKQAPASAVPTQTRSHPGARSRNTTARQIALQSFLADTIRLAVSGVSELRVPWQIEEWEWLGRSLPTMTLRRYACEIARLLKEASHSQKVFVEAYGCHLIASNLAAESVRGMASPDLKVRIAAWTCVAKNISNEAARSEVDKIVCYLDLAVKERDEFKEECCGDIRRKLLNLLPPFDNSSGKAAA